jgi:hypothetical protein
LVTNRPYPAAQAASEYGRRFSCEEGFREAKWWLGFAKARIAQIKAWSRMFALFAIALLVMTTLGSRLLEAIRKPCSNVVPVSSSFLAVMKCRVTVLRKPV